MIRLLLISNFIAIASHFNAFGQDIEKYTASFVAEWGGDTATIETFTIVGNHLFGRAIHLYPEPHLQQFEFWYNNDGSMRSLNIQYYDLSNTSVPLESKSGFLPYQMKMNFINEVINFQRISKEGKKQYVYPATRMDFYGGWIPILGQWEWLSALICEGRLDQNLKFVNSVLGIYELELRKAEEKTVIFESGISAPITFKLDENNKIKEIDALGSPWNYTISRSSPIDVEKYTKRFAEKPVMGSPSPVESFSFDINSCHFSVEYGRPYKRGRKIFGNVVPYDVMWRTGAQTATKINFDKDLKFEERVIPKGTYNLFTMPGKEKWELIFNTEENAWGSAYRAEFDFAKVEMESIEMNEIIDQFTINIEEEKSGGVIKLMWDDTMAKVHFKVVK